MEKIQIKVKAIKPATAARRMREAGLADPAKCRTAENIAAGGRCFSLRAGGSSGVFVVEVRGGVYWVSGAGAVQSRGLTGTGLAVVEQMALLSGCESVGFQTGRPGLVKLAKKAGYRVSGFIMEKNIK